MSAMTETGKLTREEYERSRKILDRWEQKVEKARTIVSRWERIVVANRTCIGKHVLTAIVTDDAGLTTMCFESPACAGPTEEDDASHTA